MTSVYIGGFEVTFGPAVGPSGDRALYHAVTYNHFDFVQRRAELGAEVDPIDVHGWTPLDSATAAGADTMVVLLKELGGKNARHEGT